MLRVLIADDHPLMRGGLKQFLADEFDAIEFGEAATTAEAIERLHGGSWDVVVLDLAMPGRGGLEVLAEAQAAQPELPVLVLSSSPEDQIAVRVLRAGARGYLNKQSAPEELVKAVRKVVDGGLYVSPRLAELLAAEVRQPGAPAPHERLSDREREVFERLVAGRSLKDIAHELSLSPKTVTTFRARILEKLRAESNVDLVHYAIEHRLLPPKAD